MKKSDGGKAGKRGRDFRTETNSKTEESNIEEQGPLEELVFEDPFEDHFEEEEYEEDYNEEEEEAEGMDENDHSRLKHQMDDDVQPTKQIWRPNHDKIEDGEALEYDPSAYVMYHSFRTEWPCLSFDFLRDNLGDNRQRVSIHAKMTFFVTCTTFPSPALHLTTSHHITSHHITTVPAYNVHGDGLPSPSESTRKEQDHPSKNFGVAQNSNICRYGTLHSNLSSSYLCLILIL